MAAMVETAPTTREREPAVGKLVTQFREILLWPLQLMPLKEGLQIHHHWELLTASGDGRWEELLDEFVVDPAQFQERHYREFVTFLPHVQRFLYGEGSKSGHSEYRESPLRVYRRKDIERSASNSMTNSGQLSSPSSTSISTSSTTSTWSCWCWRFTRSDLALNLVQDIMFLFGRAYPPGWNEDGTAIPLCKTGRMAGGGWPRAGRLRFRRPGEVPGFGLSPSRGSDRGALGVSAGAHGGASLRAIWRVALSPDRILSNADHGLSGARRPASTDAGRLRPSRLRHRLGRCAPVLLVLSRALRDRALLRPLLRGRVARRMVRQPHDVLRSRLRHGRRRALAVLRRSRARIARPVPSSVFRARPVGALSPGGAAHAVGPAGERGETAGYRRRRLHSPVPSRHPADAGNLPALHPSLLVPPGDRSGAAARPVSNVDAASRQRAAVQGGARRAARHEQLTSTATCCAGRRTRSYD